LKAKVRIESDQLAVEFAACERFGLDPIVQLSRPRDERMAVVGYHVGRNMIDNMYSHDTKPKPKNKSGKHGAK